MKREAVVAGSFYPGDPERLRQALESLWPVPAPKPESFIAAMVPHAGYQYSGRTAAQVYARLIPAATYILLGPNHTGAGAAVAVASDHAWESPLGETAVNAECAEHLLAHCPEARRDDRAHRREHSLEVQLPFLHRLGGAFSIVPVALRTHDWPLLRAVGQAVAAAVRAQSGRCVVLASSDMNHFADLKQTRALDRLALDRILASDPEGLLRTVAERGISMCGAAPAAAMLAAAQALGARRVAEVAYATSAEESGDEERVVGYAGILVR